MKKLLASFAPLALFLVLPLFGAPPDVKKEAKQIDILLAKDWEANKLQGNTPADDATFLRRIYLDIAGRIPTTRETGQFLKANDANKRARLIDQLLSGEGYVQHMFNYWADILRLHSNGNAGAMTGTAYANFVKESLRANKPYDQMVRELVGAQGKAWENGAIGYYMRDRGMPLDNMAATVRIFLGTRIECAQCHNHPFDKWTQMQFFQMAAFTYGVQTNDYSGSGRDGVRDILRQREEAALAHFREPELPKAKKDMTKDDWRVYQDAQREVARERRAAQQKYRSDARPLTTAIADIRDALLYATVTYDSNRKVTLPHDYQYPDAKPKDTVAAATMMGNPVNSPPETTGPEAYAKWMTAPENSRFTNVIANRLWKKVFGLGLIEPVDELMDGTEAVNPALMKHLEQLMVSVGYDMKAYLRVLYNTETYQRSVTKEEVIAGVPYHFTGPVLRRMSAEQMWDSFVALMSPTPDMPNMTTREEGERRIAMSRKLADGLDTLSPEEMLKGAEAVAEKYRLQAEKVLELQKKMAEARVNDDKEAAKALSRELTVYLLAARRSVDENIYTPAVMKLAAKVDGGATSPATKNNSPTKPAVAQNDTSMTAGMTGGNAGYERIKVPGYDPKEKSPEEEAAIRGAQTKIFLEEADFYGIPEKSRKEYIRYRVSVMRGWVRAAEMGSPAPRGHYLREFGQSDRETIENANYDAGVPQALALMNSALLPKILEPFSQLMLTVNMTAYPDEKVDAIYMTLLSRKPSAVEKERWMKAQEQGLTDYEDLIYALINTQQFIFIQ